MIVHIFRSSKKKLLGGFTNDINGANLPKELGPWIFQRTEPNLTETSPIIAADPKVIISDINNKGFSLQQGKITVTETISPPKKIK